MTPPSTPPPQGQPYSACAFSSDAARSHLATPTIEERRSHPSSPTRSPRRPIHDPRLGFFTPRTPMRHEPLAPQLRSLGQEHHPTAASKSILGAVHVPSKRMPFRVQMWECDAPRSCSSWCQCAAHALGLLMQSLRMELEGVLQACGLTRWTRGIMNGIQWPAPRGLLSQATRCPGATLSLNHDWESIRPEALPIGQLCMGGATWPHSLRGLPPPAHRRLIGGASHSVSLKL